MPLPSEQVYNDLNGADVREILLLRCADLLNQISEFNPNLTLPRVRMVLSIHLDIVGRTPPSIDIEDELIVKMRDQSQLSLPGVAESTHDLSATINTNPDAEGEYQPPDMVREEHGLPIMQPVKGPVGIEDKPVIREEGIKYAFAVTQDYGPMRNRTGMEGPVVGGDVIHTKNSGGGSADTRPDFSRVKDPTYRDRYDPTDVNGQKG